VIGAVAPILTSQRTARLCAAILDRRDTVPAPPFSTAVNITAELFDKDPLTTALLAKGRVSSQGTVEFVFDLNKANDLDSLGETCPDLFVTVRDTNEMLLFQSGVIWNVPFLDPDPTTRTPRTTVDLDFQRE